MTENRNMLVETVFERRGERYEPIQPPKGEKDAKDAKAEVLFRKVPNLIPVGVMVGVNDVANGLGCIRTGWSRCKLPPAVAPMVIPDEYLKLMKPAGLRKYHDAHKAHEQAVKNSDSFSMERGIAQACQHIMLPANLPKGRGFGKKYAKFQDRCNRYFKDVNVVCDNGKVSKNPRYVPPMTAEVQEVFESIFGKEIFGQMIRSFGPPPSDVVGLVKEIAQQDKAAKAGQIACNCPSYTARRAKQGATPATSAMPATPATLANPVTNGMSGMSIPLSAMPPRCSADHQDA